MISTRLFKSNMVPLAGQRCLARQAAAAMMQQSVNVFTPTENPVSASGSVRHNSSPAYRRFVQDQKQQISTLPVGAYIKPTIPAHEKGIQVPSLDVAKAMPCGFSEMENEPLVVIAEMGNHKARKEVLRRHIMMVDNVEYEEACTTLEKIEQKNRENITLAVLPYQVGIVTALAAGFGAFPMVFDVDIAMWFNHHFVTMEIPEPSELDTRLETGAWTWNWMEPALGTASFTLLCLQFSREQIKNLGLKPYTEKLKEKRAQALYKAFPQYDATILHDFVDTDRMVKTF